MQSECEVEPIRRLWAAVLSQAITDALMPTSQAVRDGNHTAAWRWIGTRDYRLVCELADICPDRLATALAPRVALAKAGNYAEASRGLVSDGTIELRHVP